MNKTLLLLFFMAALTSQSMAQTTDTKQSSNSVYSTETETLQAKKVVVKLSPNPSNGKLSVSSNATTTLHFYIFDLEGTLIYQAVLTNKEKKNIENLKKGTYLYDVFEKDESIEEGKIVVK